MQTYYREMLADRFMEGKLKLPGHTRLLSPCKFATRCDVSAFPVCLPPLDRSPEKPPTEHLVAAPVPATLKKLIVVKDRVKQQSHFNRVHCSPTIVGRRRKPSFSQVSGSCDKDVVPPSGTRSRLQKGCGQPDGKVRETGRGNEKTCLRLPHQQRGAEEGAFGPVT